MPPVIKLFGGAQVACIITGYIFEFFLFEEPAHVIAGHAFRFRTFYAEGARPQCRLPFLLTAP